MDCFKFKEEFSAVAAFFVAACAELEDEPFLQATFLASTLYTLQKSGHLSNKVDFAISHNGNVLRIPDENE